MPDKEKSRSETRLRLAALGLLGVAVLSACSLLEAPATPTPAEAYLSVTNTPLITPLPPTLTPIPSPTPLPETLPPPSGQPWEIRSVSSMKYTKDVICAPDRPDHDWVGRWMDAMTGLNLNYVSIEQPYDSPDCGDALGYTRMWVDEARARGFNVWHRHMPLQFEGIYDTVKDPQANYLSLIADYIISNPSFFRAGDIFTPVPEPQNGGIRGVTYCPQDICIFDDAAEFNRFLREAILVSKEAFQEIGLDGSIKIGYYGFDGFITGGLHNPDWQGKSFLEPETVAAMDGIIAIDHYPPPDGSMDEDLRTLREVWPDARYVISEYGAIHEGDPVGQIDDAFTAFQDHGVLGVNYWHGGPGGNEGLLNPDMTPNDAYYAVQKYFTGLKSGLFRMLSRQSFAHH